MGESLKSALPEMRTFHTLSASYSPDQRYGSPAFHLQQCDLTPDALMRTVLGALKKS